MFEVVEIKNYDTHHTYGTDWHTDYIIKTDKKYTVSTIIEELEKKDYSICGNILLEKTEGGYILKTILY